MSAMNYLILLLTCFAFKSEEKYYRLLIAVFNDLYDNDYNLVVKKAVGDDAFLVADPVEGTSRVAFTDPLTDQSERLKNDYASEKQLEIMEAYDWPIFPLSDTIFFFDKTGMFKANVVTFEKPKQRKKTFVISHSEADPGLYSVILDTLIIKEDYTFVSLKTIKDTHSSYFFRISQRQFNDLTSKITLSKGVVNGNE